MKLWRWYLRTLDELADLKCYGLHLGEAAIWSTCAHELACLASELRQLGHVAAANLADALARRWAGLAGGAAMALKRSRGRLAHEDADA